MPTEVKVLHDRGTHLMVLPRRRLPIGETVRIGPPRNLTARVIKHESDGPTIVAVLPEHLPRRTYYNHDWLPAHFHGEHGPLVGAGR